MTDYLVDNFMYYFGEELAEAYNDKKYNRIGSESANVRRKKKESVFDLLGREFNTDDILQVYLEHKRKTINRQSAWNMVNNWKRQGLVVEAGSRGYYSKVALGETETDGKEVEE